MAKQTAISSSKRERTARIRENRASEKEQIRRAEVFMPGDANLKSSIPPAAKIESVENLIEKPIHPITAMIKRKVAEDNEG
jgi:hypothetical protein